MPPRVKFSVHGPFEIPIYEGQAARLIRADEGREFFSRHHALAQAAGCYVFGMRAGKGITPFYVGKATRTFAQECFSPDKLNRYNEVLVNYSRGSPVLFLVVHPRQTGRRNSSAIAELEDFLIQNAVAGVVNSSGGKPSAAAEAFAKMMGLPGRRLSSDSVARRRPTAAGSVGGTVGPAGPTPRSTRTDPGAMPKYKRVTRENAHRTRRLPVETRITSEDHLGGGVCDRSRSLRISRAAGRMRRRAARFGSRAMRARWLFSTPSCVFRRDRAGAQ